MQNVEKIDVIVVGAGPAGVAAAVTVARGGKTVVMIDRADLAGSKNMFGGAVYLNSIKDLKYQIKALRILYMYLNRFLLNRLHLLSIFRIFL